MVVGDTLSPHPHALEDQLVQSVVNTLSFQGHLPVTPYSTCVLHWDLAGLSVPLSIRFDLAD